MTSTLIAGERDALLVDALLTIDQADALADWVESHGKRLTAVVITHGHSDHWLGLSQLLKRFPHAHGPATAKALEHARFDDGRGHEAVLEPHLPRRAHP
jgi:glyoxylase-like metal-dependent hydrolase (beta-lactamase superfamily II)